MPRRAGRVSLRSGLSRKKISVACGCSGDKSSAAAEKVKRRLGNRRHGGFFRAGGLAPGLICGMWVLWAKFSPRMKNKAAKDAARFGPPFAPASVVKAWILFLARFREQQ